MSQVEEADDEPLAQSVEIEKPESPKQREEEEEEEEPVDKPDCDDPMEEDSSSVSPSAVFCIGLKQPRSDLQHKMSVPELCRNFRSV